MGLLRRSLLMLLFSIWILCFSKLEAQSYGSEINSAQDLDARLQEYAYMAFSRPRTGIVYEGDVPSHLTGISISAMRLRSGSLWNRGVKEYKEFRIPVGVIEQPYVERLALVYQNLGNWSDTYYPLPKFTYLAPVLGLLAYDASDLSARNLPELDIKASKNPISIEFSKIRAVPEGAAPKCVWFNLNGYVNITNVVSGNKCLTYEQGHFSIVVESTAFPPKPPIPSGRHKKEDTAVWIIVGSVVGGLVLLVLLGYCIIWLQKYNQRKKRAEMENAAEVGETLHMTSVGRVKAPAATVTRTQPTIETEYVP